MKLSLIAAILLSLVMALFAIQNAQPTRVAFMGWYFDGPLIIVLVLTFGAGAAAAFLATIPRALRTSQQLATLKLRLLEASQRTDTGETPPPQGSSMPHQGPVP